MVKTFEIRNSATEFLISLIEGNKDGVQVVYQYESIWYIQKEMSQLFDECVPAITKRPKIENMYFNNFLRELSTSEHASI